MQVENFLIPVLCIMSYVTKVISNDASNQNTSLQTSPNEKAIIQKHSDVGRGKENSSKAFGVQMRSKRHLIESKKNRRSRLKARENKRNRIKNRIQKRMTPHAVTPHRVKSKHRRDDFRVYSSYGTGEDDFELTSNEVQMVYIQVPLIIFDMKYAVEQIEECYKEAVKENITDIVGLLAAAHKDGEELEKVMEEVKHGLENNIGLTLPTVPPPLHTSTLEPSDDDEVPQDDTQKQDEPKSEELENVTEKPVDNIPKHGTAKKRSTTAPPSFGNIWDEYWNKSYLPTLRRKAPLLSKALPDGLSGRNRLKR